MSGKKHGLQDKYKKLKMGGMMYYSKGALSEKQKVIASKAPPFDKIDGKDFAKMKEEKKPVKANLGLLMMKKAKDKGAKGVELLSPIAMAKRFFNKGGKVIKANKGLHAEKKKKKKEDENDLSKLPKGLRKDTTTGFGANIKKIKDD
jgi:hypothetical protein